MLAIRYTCGDRRTYAEALLHTLDFVSVTRFVPATSGAVSSGLIRLRIQQIMAKRRERWGSRKLGPGLILRCAAALLPFPWCSATDVANASSGVGPVSPNASSVASSLPSPSTARIDVPAASTEALTNATECELVADAMHRTHLRTRDNVWIDLGVGRVATASWSPLRERIAIGTADGGVDAYCTQTGDRLFQIRGETSAISEICFSPDGTPIIFANRMGEVFLADAWNGMQQIRVCRRRAEAVSVVLTQDDRVQLRWSLPSGVAKESLQRVDGSWTHVPRDS